MAEPLLAAFGLSKFFPIRGGLFGTTKGEVKAVQDVSFELVRGETLGLVGESGCGKSTLGRLLLRLEEPSSGRVVFEGEELFDCSRQRLFELRSDMQMIFQNPYSSLNPRMTAGDIVREPLEIHRRGTKQEQHDRSKELFEQVGLDGETMERYPHEFSGGQCQRIGIARALALGPRLIVADEPLSALDVSVQAQVINLLVSLQRHMSLTYVFISHDLSVVEYIADTIAVMYLGRIVEMGPKRSVFNEPRHPYTRALLDSIPVPDPNRRQVRVAVQGETPSALRPPAGCAFHPRCSFAVDDCKRAVPILDPVVEARNQTDHIVACIRKDEI